MMTLSQEKLLAWTKNFINSDPYQKDKKRELDALSVFHKKEFGDMIAYFDTNSCAEFHWLSLHEIIIKYYLKISGDRFSKDSTLRYTLNMKNQHFVTYYFDTRLLNYMCSVGVELFDFCDYCFRYEFAA